MADTGTLNLVCPHCGATNRLPRERLADGGRCGRCKGALFTGKPVALDDATLARHVESSELPLVVDFWAPWCGPCRAMAPQFEAAAARIEPLARLAKLDTEANPSAASRLGIRSVPTLIVFRGGREVARQSGAMDAVTLERWVRQALA